MPSPKMKPRSIRLSDDDWSKLQAIAERNAGTVASAIRYAIRETERREAKKTISDKS